MPVRRMARGKVVTEGELAAALLVTIPLLSAILAFVLPAWAAAITLVTALTLNVLALLLNVAVNAHGEWDQPIGGWETPLGISWHVDGLAAVLLLVTAIIGLAGVVFQQARPPTPTESDDPRLFWPLWLFLWLGLNALFLSADLFNLYVTLEMVSLASVGLIAHANPRARSAAWRYLLATLLGSSLYLLGVALLYGQQATLDLALLEADLAADAVAAIAAGAITLGLLLKAAIFPLHFWLPAAHGRASPPVSAMLSALVVAAAYYLLLRLWTGPFVVLPSTEVAVILGVLGTGAMFWGGAQALLQRHLKMVIAYSTISQLGLALVAFPLILGNSGALSWNGTTLLLVTHGLAKAALFLAAGALLLHRGRSRLDALPAPQSGTRLAWLAITLAAASLAGLPPTGGFFAKWWLARAALETGAVGWLLVLLIGTALSVAYLWRVLDVGISAAGTSPPPSRPRATTVGGVALVLAALACGLGLAAPHWPSLAGTPP